MTRLEYCESIVFREEPDGGILFDVDTGRLKLVEDVAWGICHLIEKLGIKEQILSRLEELYPEEDSMEEDLDGFLGELIESGFLRRFVED